MGGEGNTVVQVEESQVMDMASIWSQQTTVNANKCQSNCVSYNIIQ